MEKAGKLFEKWNSQHIRHAADSLVGFTLLGVSSLDCRIPRFKEARVCLLFVVWISDIQVSLTISLNIEYSFYLFLLKLLLMGHFKMEEI